MKMLTYNPLPECRCRRDDKKGKEGSFKAEKVEDGRLNQNLQSIGKLAENTLKKYG
ncbi:MAG: hypothetical protein ACUVTD_07880 [Nitrososphaerales archaeon]